LEPLWRDLAGDDALRAYQTVLELAGTPRLSVPFLREHLHPAPPVDAQRIARLLADLDSNRFAVREQAAGELEALGDLAAPALRRLLAGKPPLEQRRRGEAVLVKIDGPVRKPETLRAVRAVEVLEWVGTPEARRVLESVAAGAPEARLTQEAQASLERLAKRNVGR
jgi:hypothetical protein